MTSAIPPVTGYFPPPPGGLPIRSGTAQGHDTLATAMAGMVLSPGPTANPPFDHNSPPRYTPAYNPASDQPVSPSGYHLQTGQYPAQPYQPNAGYSQTSTPQPPPIPAASTRPNFHTHSPSAAPVGQHYYSPPEYQSSPGPYPPSQQPSFPPPPHHAQSRATPSQYNTNYPPPSQLSIPQPHQVQQPVSMQPHLQNHRESGLYQPGTSHAHPSQVQQPRPHLQTPGYPKQQLYTSSPQQRMGRPQSYIGPPHPNQQSYVSSPQQTMGTPQSYIGPTQQQRPAQAQGHPQQFGKKGRGLLSNTGKLGAGLVGGLATAVSPSQGKEKLEKWGKGKMNSFAGAMGYMPSAPPATAGRQPGAPGPPSAPGPTPPGVSGIPNARSVSYIGTGVPARKPVGQRAPSSGNGNAGPPIAAAMLAGAVAGGVGGVIAGSLGHTSKHHHLAYGGVAATSDDEVAFSPTTISETSYVDAYAADTSAADANALGLDSAITYDQTTIVDSSSSNAFVDTTASYSTDYSGYSGGSGAVYSDTTTVYADDSGAVHVDSTTTYTDGSAYGATETYSGAVYADTSYAVDGEYANYSGETTYAVETETVADAGEVAEAVGSGGGGGSWLESLGLGSSSWTDMSSWGGSLDSGDACLALI